jgi:EAL domain-containing protein (putative c-di-GMP-specific phosphodiesterase class I)
VEDADDVPRLHAAGIDCVQGNALGEPADAWPASLTPPATARGPRTPASR